MLNKSLGKAADGKISCLCNIACEIRYQIPMQTILVLFGIFLLVYWSKLGISQLFCEKFLNNRRFSGNTHIGQETILIEARPSEDLDFLLSEMTEKFNFSEREQFI